MSHGRVSYKCPSMTLAVHRHILHHIFKTLCVGNIIMLIEKFDGLIAVQIAVSLRRRQTKAASELADEDDDVFCFVLNLLWHDK